MKTHNMNTPSEIEAIADHAGLVDRADRVRLAITGPDRGKFLHNLTTNEVKRLAVGRGCEAFVTSPQGKTIGYVIMLVAEDRIWARTDPGGGELILPHLRKYAVFDDVAIDETTADTFEVHLAGPRAAELVERGGGQLPEELEYAHRATTLGGNPVRIVRETPAGLPGLTVIGEAQAARLVKDSVQLLGRDVGLIEIDAETFEYLRIAAGTPVFGKDVTEKNLPQELGRDARAVSFVKGCYLGQETVARIDALGHVNQVLKGLRLEPGSPVPQPGSLLEQDGKRVGVVTSGTLSPVGNGPLALGLVRTTHCQAGTRLNVKLPDRAGPVLAVVSDLPMSSRP
jgi:folate-binding protein YgfZ